jgi:hypothetical protein
VTTRQDDITGHVIQYPTDLPQITGEARRLADSTIGWAAAQAIHEFTNASDGGRWFTRWKLNNLAGINQCIKEGDALGLWRKDGAKDYWHHNRMTWPWVLTALALRDEWMKRNPEELTQDDYDRHNWFRGRPSAEPGEPGAE